jgi:excinuclease Cho
VAYPEHLRPWLEALPKQPGVYFFHGESDAMPLYIGKSVNIRSRVLSHLRTPEEAAMLRQSRRISWTQTAGELGALLLEARLIKEQQPLFNKRLRRNRQLCSLHISEGKPQVVYARDVDFSQTPNLYGLFANRRAALQTLQSLADAEQLCYGLLGLESLTRGRACFRSALKRCAGACCGKESVEDHQRRLLTGLENIGVTCWPWDSAIALKESREGAHDGCSVFKRLLRRGVSHKRQVGEQQASRRTTTDGSGVISNILNRYRQSGVMSLDRHP